jgi:hypothetical protein
MAPKWAALKSGMQPATPEMLTPSRGCIRMIPRAVKVYADGRHISFMGLEVLDVTSWDTPELNCRAAEAILIPA